MNAVPGQPPHVLIVDDEELLRRYFDRVLATAGYRTKVAVDCADAIALAALDHFDLLLTDLMMPEMSGADLAAVLRRDAPDLNVLYVTGFADRLFREKVTLGPREAFLEKPCGAIALRQAVSLAITGSIGNSLRKSLPASLTDASIEPPVMTTAVPVGPGEDGMIRHDLVNQLAIIRGFAEIWLLEAEPGDVRRPDFEEVHRAADTALALLERMTSRSEQSDSDPSCP